MHRSDSDTGRWAQRLFGGCELGDKRRTARMVKVAQQLASHVGSSPLEACGGDEAASEGAYRLLRNQAVEVDAIAEGGFSATVESARGCEVVVAAEDTTTLSYNHAVASQLGDVGGAEDGSHRGFIVHSVLLIDALSGRTLGLVEQQRWCRERSRRAQKHRRSERAYPTKESAKWESASRRMQARLGASLMQRVVSVCDREADVYEYLCYKRDSRYVVRAAQNRRTKVAGEGLFGCVASAPWLGERTITVAQRGGKAGRKARQARLEVRGGSVVLRSPKRDASLGELEVNAVVAREVDAPAGVEPVSWTLLTSEAVGDFEAACTVLDYYALRWRIEEFHKAWKSGTRVEHRRMQRASNLERMALILAFVAVRLLQIREALFDEPSGARATGRCTEVLSVEEWKVLWITREHTRPPRQVPDLRWAYESIAKLGGWIDTKRTGRAGWDTVWDGWFRLQDRVEGYRAAQSVRSL